MFSRFPCTTTTRPTLPSVLRVTVSRKFLTAGIAVVLSNDGRKFVRGSMLKHGDPLCKHHATRVQLLPFSCTSTTGFLAGASPRRLIRCCTAFNNAPCCLTHVRRTSNFRSGILHLVFSGLNMLHRRPVVLLHRRLHRPTSCCSVLRSVTNNGSSPGLVTRRTNIKSSSVKTCLGALISLHLVRQGIPFNRSPDGSHGKVCIIDSPFFTC